LVNVAQGHAKLAASRAASTMAPVAESVAQFAEASRAVVRRRDATKSVRLMVGVLLLDCWPKVPGSMFRADGRASLLAAAGLPRAARMRGLGLGQFAKCGAPPQRVLAFWLAGRRALCARLPSSRSASERESRRADCARGCAREGGTTTPREPTPA